MITKGDTDGVFQLESAGMRAFMGQLKPDCFEDIIAGISLFRPGPMDQIPKYVRGKHDASSVRYDHPLLKPILSNTYGCMVYQEQVMEIVRSLAGYSYGRSDLVRRAMAKKKVDVMAKEREYFVHGTDGVEGAVKRGVPENTANRIFDEMMDFASYAFNKSHAACYAVLAYRTAYLKLYYPVEFMTALINSFMGSSDHIAQYVYTARRLGLTVLPPDINKSQTRFSVERLPADGTEKPDGLAIRFGLAAIKSVGSAVMDQILSNRERNGPFADFFNFLERSEGLNKRMVEALILSGCFDSMNVKRSQLLAIYGQAFDGAAHSRKVKNAGQMSLFDLDAGQDIGGAVSIRLPDIPEMQNDILLAKEREASGLYLTGHPLDNYSLALSKLPYTVTDLMDADGMGEIKDNASVKVGGLLTSVKQRPSKNGSGMIGYATLEGVTGMLETVLFPKTLQHYSKLFYDDSPVLVSGVLNIRDERTNSLLINSLEPLSSIQYTVYIRFPVLYDSILENIASFLRRFPGNSPVVLFDASKRIQKGVPKTLFVEPNEQFLKEAYALYGEENVVLK